METTDIKRIQELVNEVNKVQGKCLETEILETEIDIIPTDYKTLHSTYIDKIIKYTEAIGKYWYITMEINSKSLHYLKLHCF